MSHRSAIPAALLVLGAVSNSVAAQPYRLEKTHVDLLFSINHAGFTQKHGSFRELNATLQYDAQAPIRLTRDPHSASAPAVLSSAVILVFLPTRHSSEMSSPLRSTRSSIRTPELPPSGSQPAV